jgi:hypothetical protein
MRQHSFLVLRVDGVPHASRIFEETGTTPTPDRFIERADIQYFGLVRRRDPEYLLDMVHKLPKPFLLLLRRGGSLC